MEEAVIHIRPAVADDAPLLSLVGTATFLESYATLIPGRDMVTHARNKHCAEIYAGWLSDPQCALWLAQTQTGAPVGYLVLIPATLPLEAPSPHDLEILRIYTLTHFQGLAIGHQMMRAAQQHAQAQGAARLVLGTYEGNVKALKFYERQGFEIVGERKFTVGASMFQDHVLAKTLT